MAKQKEMRHMLKQVIFTDICWNHNGKIRNFKETEGYGVEVLFTGLHSFVSLILSNMPTPQPMCLSLVP